MFPPPRVRGAGALPARDPLRPAGAQPLSEMLRRRTLAQPYQSAVERLYSGVGLRFNAPHTDPRFVACAFEIPDRLKIRGRQQKYVLRAAIADLLPGASARRKSFNRLKHDVEFSDTIEALADELLAPDRVRERGIFEPDYVSRLRRRPGAAARDAYPSEQAYRLWTALLTEMWARAFLDGRGRPAGAGVLAAANRPAVATPVPG
jgi:asparagine synthetase B (glutamine-hydrolysing)